MFEKLFERPHALQRQLNGPLLEERPVAAHDASPANLISRLLPDFTSSSEMVILRKKCHCPCLRFHQA